jgi:hypothetical protein
MAEFVIVSLANSLRYHAMEKLSFLVYRFFLSAVCQAVL